MPPNAETTVTKSTAEANKDIAYRLSNNLPRLLREFSKDFERRIWRQLAEAGYPCPAHANPADHLFEALAQDAEGLRAKYAAAGPADAPAAPPPLARSKRRFPTPWRAQLAAHCRFTLRSSPPARADR